MHTRKACSHGQKQACSHSSGILDPESRILSRLRNAQAWLGIWGWRLFFTFFFSDCVAFRHRGWSELLSRWIFGSIHPYGRSCWATTWQIAVVFSINWAILLVDIDMLVSDDLRAFRLFFPMTTTSSRCATKVLTSTSFLRLIVITPCVNSY